MLKQLLEGQTKFYEDVRGKFDDINDKIDEIHDELDGTIASLASHMEVVDAHIAQVISSSSELNSKMNALHLMWSLLISKSMNLLPSQNG
ncbi:unnamed protein product [Cochlearia groenlandica]